MKIRNLYILFIALAGIIAISGCDTRYNFDVENGFDDNSGNHSNVTVDMEGGIDISMYDKARIFPGLVDTLTEAHVIRTLEFPLQWKYISANSLKVEQVPAQLFSTGLYAGAGENITVINESGVLGLSIQIGAHTEDLTGLASLYKREPMVAGTYPIFPGNNVIKNPFGGNVFVKRAGNTNINEVVSLTFKGVYETPDFVVNETNPDAWAAKIKETTVPWLELRGKNVAFTVSTAQVKSKIAENMNFAYGINQLLETWDTVVEEYFYNFYGLYKGVSEDDRRAPDFPERIVLDVQLLEDVFIRNTNTGIVALNNAYMFNEMTELDVLNGGQSIAMFKALSRNYGYPDRKNPWWLAASNAVDVMQLYRVAEKGFIEAGYPTSKPIIVADENMNEYFAEAIQWASTSPLETDTVKMLGSDLGTTYLSYNLLPLLQLAYYPKDGIKKWSLFPWISEMVRRLPEYTYINNNDAGWFFLNLCDYYRVNFLPFFDYWGIRVSSEYIQVVKKRGYPYPDKAIWMYNPLVNKSIDEQVDKPQINAWRYKHDTSKWNIEAYGKSRKNGTWIDASATKNEPKAGVDKLIDGNLTTVWHSAWENSDFDGVVPDLPYYIVIDMGAAQSSIDGFNLSMAVNKYPVRKLDIEYLPQYNEDSGLADLLDKPGWTTKKTLGSSIAKEPSELWPLFKNERFFDFDNPIQDVRYVRIKISEYNQDGVYDSSKTPADNKGCFYHTLTEIGFYYYQ